MSKKRLFHKPLLLQIWINYKWLSSIIILAQIFTTLAITYNFFFFEISLFQTYKVTDVRYFNDFLHHSLMTQERMTSNVEKMVLSGDLKWVEDQANLLEKFHNEMTIVNQYCDMIPDCKASSYEALTKKLQELDQQAIALVKENRLGEARRLILESDYPKQLDQIRSWSKSIEIEPEEAIKNQHRISIVLMYIAIPLFWATFFAIFYLLSYHYRRVIDKLDNAVTTISHQLRSPIASMMSFGQALLEGIDGPLNEEQKNSLEKLLKCGHSGMKMISRILEFASAEHETMQLSLTPCNIRQLLEEVLESFEPLIHAKGLQLEKATQAADITLNIDEERLKEVFQILLENALKYSQACKISITVDKTPSHLAIHFSDSGKGLTEEEIKHIFEPYVQMGKTPEEKKGGVGIGLTLAKHIMELHQGSIQIESKPKIGSIFTVLLPLK